jgi:hypothetical protein
MNACKCDICGGFYVPDKIRARTNSKEDLEFKITSLRLYDERFTIDSMYKDIDICSTCSMVLNNWINGRETKLT